jgi:hypothetical protein
MTPASIFQNRNPHPGQEDLWTGASTELHPNAVGRPVRQVGQASFDPLSGCWGALNARLPCLVCGRLPAWPISERNRCGARSWWEEQRAPGGREMGCYGGALLLLALALHVSGESCVHARYRRAAHFGRLDPILPASRFSRDRAGILCFHPPGVLTTASPGRNGFLGPWENYAHKVRSPQSRA